MKGLHVLAVLLLAGQSLGSSTVYTIENIKIGRLSAEMLSNTKTGEYTIIVSDFGGRVEELALMSSGGKLRKVLLNHNRNDSAIMENAWWKGMVLLPWANRIAKGRYTFFDKTYQLNTNENSTDPPRLNALHGLLAGKVLTVAKRDASDSAAVLTLQYSFDGSEVGYPFKLSVSIEYTLDKNGLKLSFTVQNLMSDSPLPFYVGWHPYLACEAYKAYVTLDRCAQWVHVVLDDNLDPTGKTNLYNGFNGSTPIGGTHDQPTFYDDEFKAISPPATCSMIHTKLYDPDTDQTVVLWQDANFRFVHVFTGSASLFNENAVAIEPMSSMADGYNNHDHLSILSGREQWKAEFGLYVQ